MIIERVKTLLNIKDGLQDPVLSEIIDNISSHLLGKLKRVDKNIAEIPKELEYIIVEIAVRRYNRLGSEGMKSESVEGHRIDFYDLKEEFAPYNEIIEGYKVEDELPKKGRVMFI